jgi:C4-type Zn-finger protein
MRTATAVEIAKIRVHQYKIRNAREPMKTWARIINGHDLEIMMIVSEITGINHPDLGVWACEDSPTGSCIYDDDDDPGHDDCIYCHQPDDRL